MLRGGHAASTPKGQAMPSTRTREASADGSAPSLPKRAATSSVGIPARGSADNAYTMWAPVVNELREALGEAFSYEDVENVQTVAQGIRRTFGITAVTRGFDKATKRGTLWLEYPSVLADDGSRSEDTAAVAETLAKYAK